MITYLVCDLNRKKQYTGSTVSVDTGRPWSHLNGGSCNPPLARATAKGDQFFVFVSTDDGLDDRSEEQYYLDFDHGARWCYNINPHADGGWDHVNSNPELVAKNAQRQSEYWKQYSSDPEHQRRAAQAAHAEKNEEGKSVTAVKAMKATLTANPDHQSRAGKLAHAEKNEEGKSVFALKKHKEKDERGISKHASKMGQSSAEKTSKRVELTNMKTGEVFVFPSAHEAARQLGLNRGCICNVARGERKHHKGFTVRYIA